MKDARWLIPFAGLLLCTFGFADADQTMQMSQAAEDYLMQDYSGTTQMLNAFVGDPVGYVIDLQRMLNDGGIPNAIMKLSMVVAGVGFFVSLQRNAFSGSSAITGVLMKALMVSLLIGFSYGPYGLSKAVSSSYTATLSASQSRFQNSLNAKGAQAGQALAKMTAKTVVAGATLATGGAAAGAGIVAKAGAGTLTKNVAKSGAKTAVQKFGSTMTKVNGGLQLLLMSYSIILTILGLIVALVCNLFPLAFAFILWDNKALAFTFIGTSLGVIMAAAILPVLAYVAIDTAFVQPARIADSFVQEMGTAQTLGAVQTEVAQRQHDQIVERQLEECRQAQQEQMMECMQAKQLNILDSIQNTLLQGPLALLEPFQALLRNTIDQILNIMVWIVASAVMFLASLVIMTMGTSWMISAMGGVATNISSAFRR